MTLKILPWVSVVAGVGGVLVALMTLLAAPSISRRVATKAVPPAPPAARPPVTTQEAPIPQETPPECVVAKRMFDEQEKQLQGLRDEAQRLAELEADEQRVLSLRVAEMNRLCAGLLSVFRGTASACRQAKSNVENLALILERRVETRRRKNQEVADAEYFFHRMRWLLNECLADAWRARARP